ncbi:hypothetical protein TIFTF001_025731 [Ficus carica]|uniref:Uncharacterized protein n=1 Tax=Ficus carica TaxID=3494 RepID=A0AA88DKL9_FICCA|nr:hypothetical protein TIFTF001_025731 [Ficus carica]
MENRSSDRRIDLVRLWRFLRLFSTGLATSLALSPRLASPWLVVNRPWENREENHRKSQGKVRPRPSVLVIVDTGSPASPHWFLRACCLLQQRSPVRWHWWVRDMDLGVVLGFLNN